MKKIFSSYDISLLGLYKSILEENGIECIIKNYYLTSGVGELPANSCEPELWIIEDSHAEKAMSLLRSEKNSSWTCECGEKIEGQFFQCWKCGKVRGN